MSGTLTDHFQAGQIYKARVSHGAPVDAQFVGACERPGSSGKPSGLGDPGAYPGLIGVRVLDIPGARGHLGSGYTRCPGLPLTCARHPGTQDFGNGVSFFALAHRYHGSKFRISHVCHVSLAMPDQSNQVCLLGESEVRGVCVLGSFV